MYELASKLQNKSKIILLSSLAMMLNLTCQVGKLNVLSWAT